MVKDLSEILQNYKKLVSENEEYDIGKKGNEHIIRFITHAYEEGEKRGIKRAADKILDLYEILF